MKARINAHGNTLSETHGEWTDLCTAEDTTLSFLGYKIVPLDISVEIPAGYYAHIVPRPSALGKRGILLANSVDTIENDYCGDGDVWGLPAMCPHRDGTIIPEGTRVYQFRFVEKASPIEFVQVESLGDENRGGYGSTGERAGMTKSRQPQEMPGQRMSRIEQMFGSRGSQATPAAGNEQGPYKGFLMIECEGCGTVKVFCAKRGTHGFKYSCGHEAPLESLHPLFMHYKCGESFRHRTNVTVQTITHTYLNCKASVDMKLNSRGNAYVTVGVREGQA